MGLLKRSWNYTGYIIGRISQLRGCVDVVVFYGVFLSIRDFNPTPIDPIVPLLKILYRDYSSHKNLRTSLFFRDSRLYTLSSYLLKQDL